jgi:hypothetical protein
MTFPFTKPAKPTHKDKLGDKARARQVLPYLQYNGKQMPSCAVRLLERLVDRCNPETGAAFAGEKRLLHDCRFTHSSLTKARAILKAAELVRWTTVEEAPYRDVIWGDRRVNCYQISWQRLNALFDDLAKHRASYKRSDDASSNVRRMSNECSDHAARAAYSTQDQSASAPWSDEDHAASAASNLEIITSEVTNLEIRETLEAPIGTDDRDFSLGKTARKQQGFKVYYDTLNHLS